ncbi:MAG: acyl-CoA dehydrogenase, partial [Parvularculaceae bacterium]
LTPISKAWSTDRAIETASLGVQVHGGMGYVEETGAAQYMRDARIAAIYEGTNGIQAIDLVGRKLQGDGGAAARAFINHVREQAVIVKAGKRPELKAIGVRLEEAANALSASTDWLLQSAGKNPEDLLAGAAAYLKQFGNVAGGHYLTRGAVYAALAMSEPEADKTWLEGKIAVARFFAENYLTEAAGLTDAVTAGADAVARLDPAAMSA